MQIFLYSVERLNSPVYFVPACTTSIKSVTLVTIVNNNAFCNSHHKQNDEQQSTRSQGKIKDEP